MMSLPQITVVCLRPQLRHDHSDLIGQQSPINDADLGWSFENKRKPAQQVIQSSLQGPGNLDTCDPELVEEKTARNFNNPKRRELQWVFPYRLSHANLIDVESLGRRLQMTSARLVIIHLGEAIRKNGTRSCDLSWCKDVENPAFVDHVPREIIGFPHLMLIYQGIIHLQKSHEIRPFFRDSTPQHL